MGTHNSTLTASSLPDYVSGDGQAKLDGDLIVAEEQRNLLNKISNTPTSTQDEHLEKQQLTKKLSRNLIQVTELYNIAKENKCWDRCLCIIQTRPNATPQLLEQIKYCWNNIFFICYKYVMENTTTTTPNGAGNSGRNPFSEHRLIRTTLEHHIVKTGKALQQQNDQSIAIRKTFLASMIELACYYTMAVDQDSRNGSQRDLFERLFTSDLLINVGISHRDIFNIYDECLSSRGNSIEMNHAIELYEKWVPQLKGFHPFSMTEYSIDTHVKDSFQKFVKVHVCDVYEREGAQSVIAKFGDSINVNFIQELISKINEHLTEFEYLEYKENTIKILHEFMGRLNRMQAESPQRLM